jgi:hypothetical protein
MTQEGISSQLRTHFVLSSFVTCTFYKVSCRNLHSCVFESPQHAVTITQRHRLVASFKSKRVPIFFLIKKLMYEILSSRRHFLPLKDAASFHKPLYISILFYMEICLMRKKTSFSELWLQLSCTKNKTKEQFCFQNQSFAMTLSQPLCQQLWETHGYILF